MKLLSYICLFSAFIGVVGCSTAPSTAPTSGAVRSQARPPTVVARFLPIFPMELKKLGRSGDAEVEFIVDREGNVREPSVVHATYEEFGQASIDCILKWKFTPGIKDGRPVAARMRQSFNFDIDQINGG